MFLVSKNPKVLYGATFLTFTGALPCGPFFLAWATANSGSPTMRAVTAAMYILLLLLPRLPLLTLRSLCSVPAWGSVGSMICTVS
jgi:hypothetical protein